MLRAASVVSPSLTRHPIVFELRARLQQIREAFADGFPPCNHRNTHRPVVYLEKCWGCNRVRRTYAGGAVGAWHKERR